MRGKWGGGGCRALGRGELALENAGSETATVLVLFFGLVGRTIGYACLVVVILQKKMRSGITTTLFFAIPGWLRVIISTHRLITSNNSWYSVKRMRAEEGKMKSQDG